MISNPVLPTLDRLKASLPASADATAIAREWLSILSDANAKQDNDLTETLFLPDSYWRDILALTSDIQSIEGWDNIKSLLVSRRSHLSSIRLLEEPHNAPTITSLFPDLVILLFTFAFDTLIGAGSGVGRLVPDGDGKWRAFTIFTCLDSLKGHVEKVGVNRIDTCTPFVDPWEASRKQQIELQDRDPDVLIIGAGQAGLEIAAHLKQLDVPTLVLERLPRIGDTWRNRYDSLALHDTVWFDHPPYMPFPATWPVYCSAGKLANFFEAYAETLELSVWTSAVIEKTEWDGTKKNWSVTIKRQERVRTMTVKHLVFATGFGGGIPNMPSIPNQDLFQGKVYHSSAFKSAREFAGKKAIVVGACNSAHDIAQDFTKHGVDVTMFQRSPTYYISAEAIAFLLGGLYKEGTDLEYADRVNASLTHTVTKLIHKRVTPHVAETIDKDIRDGLEKAGFKTYLGLDNDGIFPLLFTRGGGYYIDTGGSQEIIDGRIKLKSSNAIQSFTSDGLLFDDGTTLDADVVVFATGFGDPADIVRNVCGSQIADQLHPIWGLDKSGELNSVWKHSGHDNLWMAIGNLAMCRFYSGVLALQIKATLEGTLLPKFVAPV